MVPNGHTHTHGQVWVRVRVSRYFSGTVTAKSVAWYITLALYSGEQPHPTTACQLNITCIVTFLYEG
jgi:hypothetical protein